MSNPLDALLGATPPDRIGPEEMAVLERIIQADSLADAIESFTADPDPPSFTVLWELTSWWTTEAATEMASDVILGLEPCEEGLTDQTLMSCLRDADERGDTLDQAMVNLFMRATLEVREAYWQKQQERVRVLFEGGAGEI